MDVAAQIKRIHQDSREVIVLQARGEPLSKARLSQLLEAWQEILMGLQQQAVSPSLAQQLVTAHKNLSRLARLEPELNTQKFQDQLLATVQLLHP